MRSSFRPGCVGPFALFLGSLRFFQDRMYAVKSTRTDYVGIRRGIFCSMCGWFRSAYTRFCMLQVFLYCYCCRIAAAGIYLVYKIAEDRNLADALFNVAIEKTSKNLPNPIKPGSATDNALHRLKSYGLQVGFWYLYKALPYPASAIFFLYWQIGLTAFAFCVIPSLMSFWALYHALGNRNYFAKNPDVYHDQTIAEGPNESDSEDESSSEDSDLSENEDESVPFSKRHYETRPEATLVQSASTSPTRRANAVRGRVV